MEKHSKTQAVPPPLSSAPSSEDTIVSNVSQNQSGAHTLSYDEARFTAGVISLNEAVLQEPLPDKILNLFLQFVQRLDALRDEKVQTKSFQDDILRLIPKLRAYAFSLSQNHHNADDLVQETIMKALAHIDRFTPGTNLQAWLITILRNTFYNDVRRANHFSSSAIEDVSSAHLSVRESQEKYIEFKHVMNGLKVLAPEQREAIVLIGAEGLSYEEAAEVCGCPVGTMKSRLSRARQRLENYMNGTD